MSSEQRELPWPGEELVSRVAGDVDRQTFHESGRQSVQDLEAVLTVIGRRLDSYPQILDFGCGCGRILMWLEQLAATSTLHGVDIDARAIAWAREQFPYAELQVNQPLPPLDYPDATFDLVYNHSVFTHLDEHHQDQWLAELRRVTKVGGNLILSVHGEHALTQMEEMSRNAGGDPSPVRGALSRTGIAFIEHDSHVGGPFPDAYHSTYHAPWYVFEHWSRYFTVKAYIPQRSLGFQDFVVLERPDDDATRAAGNGHAHPAAIVRQPGDSAPVATGPATSPAVERAVRRPLAGPAPGSPTRYGLLANLCRRVVLRLLAHYAEYQREVDRDLQQALAELDTSVAAARRETEEVKNGQMVHGVLTLNESNVRLWDSLRRHGERINRLENDLWEALAKKADRPGTADRSDPAGDLSGR